MNEPEAKEEPKAERRAWQEPDLIRMKAGSAEVGANPVNNDGAFTTS